MGLSEERINLVVCEFYKGTKKMKLNKIKQNLRLGLHSFFNGQGANLAWW